MSGLLSSGVALAEPAPHRLASETQSPSGQSSEAAARTGINDRIDALATETAQLRVRVAEQSDLLRRLMLALDGLLPVSSQRELDPLGSKPDGLKACRSDIAELSARLHQQQLVVDEAQRRAEKAEKGAAAMNEAQAQAATEIERLSTELATAKARQSEALQQAVELERQLATAEARLARFTANPGGRPVAVMADAEPAPIEPAVALVGAGPEAELTDDGPEANAAITSGAVQPPEARLEPSTAPVFYEVRAADTLSRISARVYGDASAWERIYDANRDLLQAPEALSPGMSLVIP